MDPSDIWQAVASVLPWAGVFLAGSGAKAGWDLYRRRHDERIARLRAKQQAEEWVRQRDGVDADSTPAPRDTDPEAPTLNVRPPR